jgi:hypothetical protein
MALRTEICNGNDHRVLRALARKLIEKGLDGDLPSIREIADRSDGKQAQAIERSELPLEAMTDDGFALRRNFPHDLFCNCRNSEAAPKQIRPFQTKPATSHQNRPAPGRRARTRSSHHLSDVH